MPYTTETVTNEAPAMVCPICGKNFFDVHSFAAHMNEHSQEEKKRKAEEAKKKLNEERDKDIENLVTLRAEVTNAEKKLKAALDDYRKKYGGLVFPYTSNHIDDLLRNISYWF